jgi:hypothetical protein
MSDILMFQEDSCSTEVAHVMSDHEKYDGKMYEWRRKNFKLQAKRRMKCF